MSKKALSAVVGTVILIALAVGLISIVWIVVNDIVKEELGSAESCFNIIEKITINSEFTCYNSENNELNVSISVGEVNVEKILVSVTSQEMSKGFEIKQGSSDKIKFSDTEYGNPIYAPEKNSGITYTLKLESLTGTPKTVKISPTIEGTQCGVVDELYEITNCNLLS